MRSHSVSAEGGTAVILEDEGDNQESHIYDTIKGSDFLADQDVAERLVSNMPFEISQLISGECLGQGETTALFRSAKIWRILISKSHVTRKR